MGILTVFGSLRGYQTKLPATLFFAEPITQRSHDEIPTTYIECKPIYTARVGIGPTFLAYVLTFHHDSFPINNSDLFLWHSMPEACNPCQPKPRRWRWDRIRVSWRETTSHYGPYGDGSVVFIPCNSIRADFVNLFVMEFWMLPILCICDDHNKSVKLPESNVARPRVIHSILTSSRVIWSSLI